MDTPGPREPEPRKWQVDLKHDGLCTENHRFCTKYDEVCTNHDGLCTKNTMDYVPNMMFVVDLNDGT